MRATQKLRVRRCIQCGVVKLHAPLLGRYLAYLLVAAPKIMNDIESTICQDSDVSGKLRGDLCVCVPNVFELLVRTLKMSRNALNAGNIEKIWD